MTKQNQVCLYTKRINFLLYVQFVFYVSVFNTFCCYFNWEREVYYLLETSVILFCSCNLLVLGALWFLSCCSALDVGHLVLFLLFLLLLGVKWILSLGSAIMACFCFGSLQYSVVFGIVPYLHPVWVTFSPCAIVLVFVPHIKDKCSFTLAIFSFLHSFSFHIMWYIHAHAS